MKTIDSIQQDFLSLEDWQERYRYIIELGEAFEAFPESLRIEANKVHGCSSQVWIITQNDKKEEDPIILFNGSSDSHIVRGLIVILFSIFSNKPASKILEIDAEKIFFDLGLDEHLTLQRSNGLRSMVKRIRQEATKALIKKT